jgi:pSer/pThr/pTyr-binding forkhead associated (FHA) protein
MTNAATRKLQRRNGPKGSFQERSHATLVIVNGGAEGTEYPLDRDSVVIGRDPDADIPLDDKAVSKRHAALELGASSHRIRDLGSTNGMLVNGAAVRAADLKHGDRIVIGEHEFQYLVESRERPPRTFRIG